MFLLQMEMEKLSPRSTCTNYWHGFVDHLVGCLSNYARVGVRAFNTAFVKHLHDFFSRVFAFLSLTFIFYRKQESVICAI